MTKREAPYGVPRIVKNTIDRAAVFERLDQGAPFTFVQAPRGFGKTVAIARWLKTIDAETVVIWVTWDPVNSRPEAFWNKVATRLVRQNIGIDSTASHDVIAAVKGCTQRVLFVVDNADHLEEPLHQVLELARATRHVNVITSSLRVLPVADRAAFTMDTVTVDASHLKFSLDEVHELFTKTGANDRSHLAPQLHKRLGGWPVLMHRAALLVCDDIEPPMGVGEVINAVPHHLDHRDDIPASLFEIAVRLATAAHLDEDVLDLIGRTGGVFDIDHAVAELKIRGWAEPSLHSSVRLIPAIGDWLARHEAVEPGELDKLHRALIAHYAESGQWNHALDQAIRIDDPHVAADLIERGWMWMFITSREKIRAAINQLPARLVAERPVLRAVLENVEGLQFSAQDRAIAQIEIDSSSPQVMEQVSGQLAMITGLRSIGQFSSSAAYARRLEPVLRQMLQTDTAQEPSLTSALLLATVMQAGFSLQLNDEMSAALPIFQRVERQTHLDANGFVSRDVAGTLAHHYALEGRLDQARYWSQREAEFAPIDGWFERRVATSGNIARAWLAAERLDESGLQAAMRPLNQQRSDDEFWSHIVQLQTAAELFWGSPELLLPELEQLSAEYAPWAPPGSYAHTAVATAIIDLHLACGMGSSAITLLRKLPESHPAVTVRHARLALLRHDWSAVIGTEFHGDNATLRQRGELAVLHAAAWAQSDVNEAARRLPGILGFLERTGLRTPLAGVPKTMLVELLPAASGYAELLKQVLNDGLNLPYPQQVEIVELTPAERNVLDGLARGLAVKAIAAQQHLSVNTIKTHNRTLYRKLGARSRSEALARARRLGLRSDASQ